MNIYSHIDIYNLPIYTYNKLLYLLIHSRRCLLLRMPTFQNNRLGVGSSLAGRVLTSNASLPTPALHKENKEDSGECLWFSSQEAETGESVCDSILCYIGRGGGAIQDLVSKQKTYLTFLASTTKETWFWVQGSVTLLKLGHICTQSSVPTWIVQPELIFRAQQEPKQFVFILVYSLEFSPSFLTPKTTYRDAHSSSFPPPNT